MKNDEKKILIIRTILALSGVICLIIYVVGRCAEQSHSLFLILGLAGIDISLVIGNRMCRKKDQNER